MDVEAELASASSSSGCFKLPVYRRLVGDLPGASEPLNEAADRLEKVAGALGEVQKLFPFPPGEELDAAACKKAVKHLPVVRRQEKKAIKAVNEACKLIRPGC